MKQTFTIEGRLPGMNEYTRACRTHYHVGADMKRDSQDVVCWAIKAARLKPYDGAVRIRYTFYEKPNRGQLRDKSNIAAFAVKVIEDALQEMQIIKNDNWEYVEGYSCSFFRASDNPRIEVTLEETR